MPLSHQFLFLQATGSLVASNKVLSLPASSPNKIIQVALSKGASVGGQLVRLPNGNTAIISGLGGGTQPVQLAANPANHFSTHQTVKLGKQCC